MFATGCLGERDEQQLIICPETCLVLLMIVFVNVAAFSSLSHSFPHTLPSCPIESSLHVCLALSDLNARNRK